jgi:predicted tellurium resistance membrane protein TerC
MFVGGKMALMDVVKIDAAVSLAVVVSILAIGIVASAIRARRSAPGGPAARSTGP